MSYKNALNRRWKNKHEVHIQEIRNEYMSVMNKLKLNIAEVEELVKIRRKSRMEFSFSLNKKLLKSISNLSLEVMNLN